MGDGKFNETENANVNAKDTKGNSQSPKGELLRDLMLAKEGSENAFARLVSAYRPMLDAAVAQYRGELSPEDTEELEQEALVAFHRAVKRYDVLYGDVSFGLYAKIVVGKALISALRPIWKERSNSEILPLEEDSDSFDSCERSPADIIIEEENEDELKEKIRQALSRYENTVWWMYYSGMSPSAIAAKVGKSPKSVANALGRIRLKLRTLFS